MSGQVERRQALIDEVNEREAPDGETALALIASDLSEQACAIADARW